MGWLSFQRWPGAFFAAFKEELASLGWKEGAQIAVDARWADGQDDRLVPLTQELAAKKPALIVASTIATVSAAKTAPRMPIVMVAN